VFIIETVLFTTQGILRVMFLLTILHHYFIWHYTVAFREILHVWKNFFWFTFHFFSISLLFRSLFAPWKRMTETRSGTFNLEDLAGVLIINLLSRLIGFLLRSLVIIIGLCVLSILLIGLICLYCFWVTAPLILIGCLYYGLLLLV
jgi:hypothetical protein